MSVIVSRDFASKKLTIADIRERVLKIVAEYDKIEPEKVNHFH